MTTTKRVSEAKALFAKAIDKELAEDYTSALKLYTDVAQTLLNIQKISTDARVNAECADMFTKAVQRGKKVKERMGKVIKPIARDPFSTLEQETILNNGSKVNGFTFKSWREPTNSVEFLGPAEYREALKARLPDKADWRPARDLVPGSRMFSSELLPTEIVQSIVTNCSLVSSLIVCWNHHRHHQSKLLLSQLYPQGPDSIPIESVSGRYSFRMHINGAPRIVDIDSTLPIISGDPMFITTYQRSVLWPAIVEKAYMTMHGSYIFSGSDSCTDLSNLIDWIPEHLSFRDSGFERETQWTNISKAFRNGDVLITLGTGSVIPGHVDLHLMPSHSYAVIDLSYDERRMLEIVNPWRSELQQNEAEVWNLSWDDVCTTFDGLYLSWNPAIFKHSISHHRTWAFHEDGNLGLHHHIRASFPSHNEGGNSDCWILLSRHVTNREDICPYISLHLFQGEDDGAKFIDTKRLAVQGIYHDGLHTLVKFRVDGKQTSLSIIPSIQFPDNITPKSVSYTLKVFSQRPVTFDESPPIPMTNKTLKFDLNTKNSGGNITHRTFLQNPQWILNVGNRQEPPSKERQRNVKVQIQGKSSKDLPLNVKVVRHSDGRLNELIPSLVVLDSGMYTYGLAFAEATLPEGQYTLILSSYEPDQYGSGTLSISCSENFDIVPAPQEGAGMFSKTFKDRWFGKSAAGGPTFGRFQDNPTYMLTTTQPTDIRVRLLPSSKATESYPMNVTLYVQLNETDQSCTQVASSGPYTTALYGVTFKPVATKRIDRGVYFLIVSTQTSGFVGDYELRVWTKDMVVCEKVN